MHTRSGTEGELQALLGQCKNSADDQPRLAVAEWLEQHGEPERARFVRLQLNTAKNVDRAQNWYPGRFVDEAEQARLLRKNIGTWIHGFFRNQWWIQFDDVPEEEAVKHPAAKFERGTITVNVGSLTDLPVFLQRFPSAAFPWLESLETGSLPGSLATEVLKSLEHFTVVGFCCDPDHDPPSLDWLNRAGIRRLSIDSEDSSPTLVRVAALDALKPHELSAGADKDDLSGWQALMASPVLCNTRSLSSLVYDQPAAIVQLAQAQCLQQLRDLDLYIGGQEQPIAELRTLFDSPVVDRLAGLKVTGWSGPLHGVVGALAQSISIRRLKELDLAFNAVQTEELTSLVRSPIVEGLTRLSFSSGTVTPEGLQALAEAPGLEKLDWLDLSCTGGGDRGMVPVVTSARMKNLRRLYLARCDVTDETVRAIASSPHMASLEDLHLSNNPLSSTALGALADSAHVGSLRRLNIELFPYEIDTFRHLLASAVLRNLEYLAVGGPGIGPEHVQALVASPMLGNLRSLFLSAPNLHQGEVNAIMDAPWLTGLVELYLDNTGLDDEGVRKLTSRNMNALGFLKLGQNVIGEAGARALLEWDSLKHIVELSLYRCSVPADLRAAIDRIVLGRPPSQVSHLARLVSCVNRLARWFRHS